MSINSTLYFKNADGFGNQFPLGGLPLLNNDLKNIENNLKLFGLWPKVKNLNVILSGCLVSDVNTNLKTCSITEGYFILDGVVYYTEGFSTVYPFSLQPNSTTDNVRTFQNGNTFIVSKTYNFSIRTTGFASYNSPNSTGNDALTIKPNNLGTEIFFDPFTNQRLDYFDNYYDKTIGQLLFFDNPNFANGQINFTQTGNQVIGTERLNEYCTSANNRTIGRWKFYGYHKIGGNGVIKNNSNLTGQWTGDQSINVRETNLPFLGTLGSGEHNHGFNNAFFAENPGVGNGTNPNVFTLDRDGFNRDLSNIIGTSSAPDSDNKPRAFNDLTNLVSNHNHEIRGANGETLNGTAIVINPYGYNTTMLSYISTTDLSIIDAYYIKNRINKNHY